MTSIENSFAVSKKIKQNKIKLEPFSTFILSYKESFCFCNKIINFKIGWKALENKGFCIYLYLFSSLGDVADAATEKIGNLQRTETNIQAALYYKYQMVKQNTLNPCERNQALFY